MPLAANLSAAAESIGKLIWDETAPTADRIEGLRALGRIKAPKAVAVLAAIAKPAEVKPGPTSPIQIEAIAALADQLGTSQGKDPATQQALLALQSLVTGPNTPEAARKAAVNSLAGSRPGGDWLLELREQNKMPASVVAEAEQLLRSNSPFPRRRKPRP